MAESNLHAIQAAFGAHLRDPEGQPPPPGMEERGLAVYRDLVFRNAEGLLASTFPVLKETLGEEAWEGLVRDFLAEHGAATPLFPEMPGELVRYLAGGRDGLPGDPPFLAELAHYEWVELDLSLRDLPTPPPDLDPAGDLLAGTPELSPLARRLAYRFPVQHIGPEHRPAEPPAEPTLLVVHGDGDGEVGFLAVSAPVWRLLELAEAGWTGAEAAGWVGEELGMGQGPALMEQAREGLEDLRRRGALWGVRPPPAQEET